MMIMENTIINQVGKSMAKKQEICSCGAKQDIRYKFINVTTTKKGISTTTKKKVPCNRNELICHCDSCGKKWGDHKSCLTEGKMKFKCVAYKDFYEIDKETKHKTFLYHGPCNKIIKDQTQERYNKKGNYCNECNASCEHNKNSKEAKKVRKLLNSINRNEQKEEKNN